MWRMPGLVIVEGPSPYRPRQRMRADSQHPRARGRDELRDAALQERVVGEHQPFDTTCSPHSGPRAAICYGQTYHSDALGATPRSTTSFAAGARRYPPTTSGSRPAVSRPIQRCSRQTRTSSGSGISAPSSWSTRLHAVERARADGQAQAGNASMEVSTQVDTTLLSVHHDGPARLLAGSIVTVGQDCPRGMAFAPRCAESESEEKKRDHEKKKMVTSSSTDGLLRLALEQSSDMLTRLVKRRCTDAVAERTARRH